MNIPDEAVEAAAVAMLERSYGTREWADLPAEYRIREKYLDEARVALEAAAPHLMAQLAGSRDGEFFRFTWAQREWLRSAEASA